MKSILEKEENSQIIWNAWSKKTVEHSQTKCTFKIKNMEIDITKTKYTENSLLNLLENTNHQSNLPDLIDVEYREIPIEKKKKKKKKKEKETAKAETNDKAIQSFFKIVTRKQIEQVSQVDYKANILITLCSLLASVVGSLFLAHYDLYKIFTPSVIVLTLFSIISVFFSMLVIVSPTCPKSQAGQRKFNVINFNQFSNIDLKDYKKEVNKTLKKEEDIYETLSEDLYRTGKILKQKFKFISWAYRIFLSGIFIAFILGLCTKIF